MRHALVVLVRTASLLVLPCVSHLFAQDSPAPPASPTIPFQLLSDFLVVVNAQVGDVEGLKFIVDTGASYTLIDRKLADRLHLRCYPGKITNFDRDLSVEWADIPQLRLGPIRTGTFRVMVAKAGDYSELAENVDGIIGLDLLGRSKKLFIDYERQTVSFVMAEGGASERSSPAYLAVPFVVQGFPLHLILDTGFQGILLYKDRLRQGLPDFRTEGEATRVGMGRLQTTQVKLPGVRVVGPETVATVLLMEGPNAGAPPGVDGYLGVASLNAKRVEFDFAAKVLRWQ